MEVSDNPKITKPVPTLVLQDNMVNFVIIHKAIIELVTRYNWTWEQAIEWIIPDHIATRIMSLWNQINPNLLGVNELRK